MPPGMPPMGMGRGAPRAPMPPQHDPSLPPVMPSGPVGGGRGAPMEGGRGRGTPPLQQLAASSGPTPPMPPGVAPPGLPPSMMRPPGTANAGGPMPPGMPPMPRPGMPMGMPPPGQPMMGMGGLPMPFSAPGMPPTGMEPPHKKQKTTDEMLSEEDFIATHGSMGTFQVKCPADDSKEEWKLSGQVLKIQAGMMMTVKDFKAKIAELTGLPAGSQKLKADTFLKDAWTLAKHNITPTTILELGVQARGGRR